MGTASEIPSGREDKPVNGAWEEPVRQAPPRPADALTAALAGLQAGMAGTLAMLAWLGLSSAWQGHSFWRTENLMASAFYGSGIRAGFSGRTISGVALYLVLYSLLGAAAALVLRERLARVRTVLLSIGIALFWYYVSFHWIWRSVAPPLAFLHAQQSTLLGHVIYGLWLGRYPEYLGRDQGSVVADQVAQAPGAGEVPAPDAQLPEG